MEIQMTNQNMAEGIRPAMVNRGFLHSNSTSHEWMFGAMAELIDNANDPDVSATQFWLNLETIGTEHCLTFTDNGAGMDTETLHRMLSFGFSDKQEVNGHLPIGRYGNGFKSGSMRVGRDAIIFTRQHTKTMSVGFLSQTYLEAIDSQTVVVPIVTWDVETKEIIYPDTDSKGSLDAILMHSPFRTEEQLLEQFVSIKSREERRAGTRILIYNLTHDDAGNLELDFDSDIDDIRLPEANLENTNIDKTELAVALYRTSLRKYVSIMYLKPRIQIFLRGKKVKCLCLSKLLTKKKQSSYTPKRFTLAKPIKILFGQNPNEDEHGIMMYNRNRLIQAFRKNIARKQNDSNTAENNNLRELMEVVIGVVELDCLTPNHIKQGFQDDIKFRTIEQALTNKLSNYCADMVDDYIETKNSADPKKKERDLWVQCDNAECQKWRRLPFGTKADSLPEKWYCRLNLDPYRNHCSVSEEPEKDPEVQKQVRTSKRRQSKPDSETQPSTTELAATPAPAATPSSSPSRTAADSWRPPEPPSPRMNRLLDTLQEHIPAPGTTANSLRSKLQRDATNIVAPRAASVSKSKPFLRPRDPPAVGALSPPVTKRQRSAPPSSSPVHRAEEQEVIVLDDDDDYNDEDVSGNSDITNQNYPSLVKSEPDEEMEIEPCVSAVAGAGAVQVKEETATKSSVQTESSSNDQSRCKPDPSPSTVTTQQASLPDVDVLLRELADLRAQVSTQEVMQARLETKIRELREENQQKEIRIQELENLLQSKQSSDSQDEVIVIEDSRSTDSTALQNLRQMIERYLKHVNPKYVTPINPLELEKDFASLINVLNFHRNSSS